MAFRGNESGMDFEYDNRTGAVDARSPFAHVAHNAQRFPQGGMARKRPYSAFDSPQKTQISSQFNFNSPNKPLPAVPGNAFNSIFSTPRKINTADFDDSSAGETPKSPERDDSNAPTPERTGFRGTMAKLNFGGANQQSQAGAERGGPDAPIDLEQERDSNHGRPSAPRRESWYGRFKEKWQSPGRGEVQRGGAVTKRPKKSRETQVQRRLSKKRRRHSVSDTEDDHSLQRNRSPRKASGMGKNGMEQDSDRPHWVSNLFTFIGKHPTVPAILSFYAQLAFNVFLLAACAYMLYCFWSAVQGDIDKKAFEAMAEVMAESAQCLHDWNVNKCDRATRVPAMQKVCEGWEACMNRDATKIGRARVSAHTFAEIFNSFVEPISWKAMVFTTFIVFGGFATTNMAFGHFREKAQHHPPPHSYFPPPTPQRSFSGQPLEGYYGTPWQQPQSSLEPQPSPVRRIAYDKE